jgi:hypothetical protein
MIVRLSLLERVLHALHRLPSPVLDSFASVLYGKALALAVRRGIFEECSRSPQLPSSLAQTTGMDAGALEILLMSLELGGYLEVCAGGYGLTAESRRWLLRDSPDSMVSLVGYFETLHRRWETLEGAVEQGGPESPYYSSFGQEDWRLYVAAMYDLARFMGPYVIPRLAPPPGATRLLDLGGSHGYYAAACCRRTPGMRATILDLPGSVKWGREIAVAEQAADRLEYLPADLFSVPFPPSQDVVLLFNVVHGLTPEQNVSVVRRALEALREGGKLFILDQCLEGKRRSDLARLIPLMVGLNLLIETGGRSYGTDEIISWCGSARTVRRRRVNLPGVTLIEAVR